MQFVQLADFSIRAYRFIFNEHLYKNMIVCWIYIIYSKEPKCHLRASIFQNFLRRHAPRPPSITHNQKLQFICVKHIRFRISLVNSGYGYD